MRRLYALAGMLIGIVIISAALIVAGNQPYSSNAFTEARARWDSYNTSRYQMTIVAFAAPVVPVALDLVIEDDEIVTEVIIACERPIDEYPERWCEPTRTYYAYVARRTIDDLFEDAERCLQATWVSLAMCPFVADDFQGFDSHEAMSDVIQQCQDYLDRSDYLCTVEFDDTHGYPLEINFAYIDSLHPGSVIYVRDFQLLD